MLKWLLMFVLVLIWGSSYILMKRGLETFLPMQVGALRISIAFLVLLPFAIWKIRKVERKKLKIFAIAGLMGSGIPAYLFAEAQTGIDSQIAGILNSVAPLFTLIAGVLFFGVKTRWINVAGVFVGLTGAIGLLSADASDTFNNNLSFGIFVIIATLLYATNINVVKKYLKDFDAVTITCVSFVFIGIPSLIYLLACTDFITRLSTHPGAFKDLGFITILAVMGTALAGFMYNYLIKISSVLFTASVTYLIPSVAILWGIYDGEPFFSGYFLWIAVIFLGVFLVNKERKVLGKKVIDGH